MARRLTWLGVGLVAGFGASKWVERRIRRRLARWLPARRLSLTRRADVAERARDVATNTMADLRSTVSNAVEQGRTTMAAREAELRRQLHLPEEAVVAEVHGRHRALSAAARRSTGYRPR